MGESGAVPSGDDGGGLDVEAEVEVGGGDGGPGGGVGWGVDEGWASGSVQDDLVVVEFDAVATFVDESVVERAEGDEVVELVGAVVGAVNDVVGVGVAGCPAAGDAAAAVVAGVDFASDAGWDGLGGFVDEGGLAVGAGDDGVSGGVAGEAAGGLGGDVGGALEVAGAVGVVGERKRCIFSSIKLSILFCEL